MGQETENHTDDLMNLQMLMTNSSFGHEYARKEFSESHSFDKKEKLLAKMDHYKRIYFEAREAIQNYFPEKLDAIEKDLLSQKQTLFTEYNA